ncbi:hypothetical protein [Dactylosporangium salmoneum]|uniref:hypothetical protein n=1 Tax=Dactylosporangium salmoneum TaxID=53361 RepID=UPI0031D3839F
MSKGRQSFGSGRFGRQGAIRPIPRPGLLRLLDGAGRMVVLVGGAGAGKSTLLDAWVAARNGVMVDAAGLQVSADGAVVTADGTAVRGPLAVDGVTAADGALLRRLARRDGVVVAADEDPGVEEALRISAWELAFAEDETYQVLAGAFGDAEAADELAPDLHLLLHGWPALVALAGVWLAQHPSGERRQRLRSLARVEERLEEYLLGAVLDGLGDGDREMLRRLARVPAVDARLADRLDITEDLAAVPPFLHGLSCRPGWFAVADSWRPAVVRALPMPEAEAAALRATYAAEA